MKISLTGVSISVWVILAVLNHFGFTANEGSVTSVVESIINVASFVGMLYGQYRRPEVMAFVLKNGGTTNIAGK